MAPHPTGLTRRESRIATGTSWARKVSTCGPAGMSVHSVSRGGASEITPNLESVEQVAVSTSNAPASEGRNMGAHVNIVSKAGTNQFHYDADAQAWVYNLDTKALGLVTGNCYRIDVAVNGTLIANAFAVFQPTK